MRAGGGARYTHLVGRLGDGSCGRRAPMIAGARAELLLLLLLAADSVGDEVLHISASAAMLMLIVMLLLLLAMVMVMLLVSGRGRRGSCRLLAGERGLLAVVASQIWRPHGGVRRERVRRRAVEHFGDRNRRGCRAAAAAVVASFFAAKIGGALSLLQLLLLLIRRRVKANEALPLPLLLRKNALVAVSVAVTTPARRRAATG